MGEFDDTKVEDIVSGRHKWRAGIVKDELAQMNGDGSPVLM